MAWRKNREYEDDDGRTIVPMNVDGMPWYTKGFTAPPAEDEAAAPVKERRPMSGDEARGYAWAAVKASLLIGSVFAVAFTLFILFCYFVWFR